MKYFVEKGCYYQFLFWGKDNPVPFGASNFLSDKEICLCFYEKGAKFNNGCDHKKTWFISHINSQDKKEYLHPTCKPLSFVKEHILNSTNKDDVVLDCYMGSGTTCVACKELGRQYIGIEINPKYYEIAQDRLNGITQKEKKNNAVQLKLFD